MKKITNYWIATICILVLSGCSEPDEIARGSKKIEATNLIKIETLSSYHVNDLLYINASFSRYLPEKGFDTLLDIYKTTKSEEYGFNFYLEKKSTYGTWNVLDIGTNLLVQKGKYYPDYYGNLGICILDQVTNKYEFRGGIPLLEKGTYRINFTRQLYPLQSDNSVVYLTLMTTIENVDNQSNYNFTVE
jgi:hypothetical protein